MAGQRFLVPYVRVRLLPPQPFLAWSSSGLGRRPLKAEIGGSNPLQATIECYRSGDCLACFVFLVRLRGFEPMRWNSVKKTAQWAVFRNSPEGFSLRVRGARSAARNPLQATTISKARSDERAFLLPLHDALTAHFAFKLRLTYLPIRFALLSGRTALARASLAASCSTYPIRAHPTLFSGGSNR